MDVLVDVDELYRLVTVGPRPVVLDVRWKLGQTDGRQQYQDEHLPGAVYVDLETELAAPATPELGRHPLPEVSRLQRAARRWGVRQDVAVIAYDDNAGMTAARAWWLLRWAGVRDVRLLDGGLAAWRRAGYPLDDGDVVPSPGDVVLTSGGMPVVDAEAAAQLARDGVLLDARAAERYRGDAEPIDPRAGHIPGALSAPTTDNVDDDGRFRPADQLRRRFAAVGISGSATVGAYCGSGVTAAHEVAALAIAGVDAALYPGSWSQWSADPDRPAATGAQP
ncbi:sulfurtransferase [Phytoactinopolyspora limicola]|uniref:sulfurtransferase n=1 Tax=Phytoactinopolyspora limicola TaxID=2715536 RepID=UPI00140806ED|nr:sulfurtransferase [Phytoactinopolyspora limicola]